MQGLQPELLSDLPEDTYSKIRQLEDSFSISTPGLKILTNHFIKEFAKGWRLTIPNLLEMTAKV